VRSDDPVFGWGPPGEGFVFQKAFVEFFCSSEDFHGHLKPLLTRYGHDEFAWFATNDSGGFESSVAPPGPLDADLEDDGFSRAGADGLNAVTWGVFRGKEIITPTIIEEVSFRAWGDEAFRIWDQWRQIFPRGSATERFINQAKNDVWLVCVIGQQFGAGGNADSARKRLWRVLADGEEP
jgi:methylenetetrahydrofolate reductase (NADPH)